jgi:hypothetical protein
MDMKLRIIIIVFTVIIVFYFFHFLFKIMQKKEHFSTNYYDQIEKYEDAPPEKEYDKRIFLLNEIDKLEITDSKVKSNVMESVFSDGKLKDMTPSEQSAEIKAIYEKQKTNAAANTDTTTSNTAPQQILLQIQQILLQIQQLLLQTQLQIQ